MNHDAGSPWFGPGNTPSRARVADVEDAVPVPSRPSNQAIHSALLAAACVAMGAMGCSCVGKASVAPAEPTDAIPAAQWSVASLEGPAATEPLRGQVTCVLSSESLGSLGRVRVDHISMDRDLYVLHCPGYRPMVPRFTDPSPGGNGYLRPSPDSSRGLTERAHVVRAEVVGGSAPHPALARVVPVDGVDGRPRLIDAITATRGRFEVHSAAMRSELARAQAAEGRSPGPVEVTLIPRVEPSADVYSLTWIGHVDAEAKVGERTERVGCPECPCTPDGRCAPCIPCTPHERSVEEIEVQSTTWAFRYRVDADGSIAHATRYDAKRSTKRVDRARPGASSPH